MSYVYDLFGKLCCKCFDGHTDSDHQPKIGLELDNHIRMGEFPLEYYISLAHMRPLEKEFLKQAKGRVLDLGCGTGRIGMYLKDRKDYDVLAVDKSPSLVHLARGFYDTPTEKLDFNKKLPEGKFDTVIMYGNGLGSPGTIENLENLLRRLLPVTTDDAIIIGESNDPYKMQTIEDKDYQRRNLKLGRYIGQRVWRHVSGKNFGAWHKWVQIPPGQLAKSALLNGWKLSDKAYEENGPGTQWGAYFAILRKF